MRADPIEGTDIKGKITSDLLVETRKKLCTTP